MKTSRCVLVIAIVLVACSTDEGGGGGSGGDATTGTGGDGTGGTCAWSGQNAAPTEELFSCHLPSSCPDGLAHASQGWCNTSGAAECAGDLVASSSPGVLRHRDAPGPGPHISEYLVVLGGEGTAWLQTRRYFDDDGRDAIDVCWELDPVQLCDVVEAACNTEPETWDIRTGLVDCVEVEVPACEEVEGALG